MATTIGSANGIVRDLDWVQHSFMLAGERVELSKDLVRYRNLSSADFKYTATGFGENIILNPAPPVYTFRGYSTSRVVVWCWWERKDKRR